MKRIAIVLALLIGPAAIAAPAHVTKTRSCPTPGWPVHLKGRAGRVAWCESKCRANARNPRSTATGPFQILIGTWRDFARPGEVRTNYTDNSVVAYRVYKVQGWGAWEESRGCWS